MKETLLSLLALLSIITLRAQERVSLAGQWNFTLDSERTHTPTDKFTDKIALPGTTDEAGFGTKSEKSDFGILTRRYKYYGLAWYSREIEIPKNWEGKEVVLELERVLWQSKLYLDGREISMQHIYTIEC